MVGREFVRAPWPLIAVIVTAVAILGAAVMLLSTMPPRTTTLATGPEGGAYYEAGRLYKAILAREGVELRLVSTGGALENVSLLSDPRSGVSAALVEGGSIRENGTSELESLGTLFYEPLWVFYRAALRPLELDGLRGLKVSVGLEGSGTRALSLEILKRSGIDQQVGALLSLSPRTAGEKLLAGEIDVAFMVIAWGSPIVRQLLADERTELLHLRYADAYIALFPFLTKVVVPAGVADIEKNRPATDVTLVSAKASLIVRKELHPAIQYILLNAAAQVHSGPGMFQRAGQFPAAEGAEVPLSDYAFQYYKSGRPFLQNYLPFWMAALVSRLLILLLIPVLGVLYPIVRFMPTLYDWAVRRRISHLYRELRVLEYELEALGTDNGADKMATQLERLEQRANHLKIPIAYAGMLYMLRNHIALVRERLRAYSHREPGHAAPDDPRPAT